VPATAAVAGSPIALAAVEVLYSECRTQSSTSETSVVTGLTVLLLCLVVAPLNWGLRAVGCLLLLLWPDHPSPLLLLRSSTLSVGHNPKALRRS
jgi:hypothetical protein